jgi:hypothetical protein
MRKPTSPARATHAGRRRFLSGAAALGASALPGAANAQSDLVPPWTREQGQPILTPPYGMPLSARRCDVRPRSQPGTRARDPGRARRVAYASRSAR